MWSIVVLNHALTPQYLTLILSRNHTAALDLYIDLRPPKPSISRRDITLRVYAHLRVLLPLSSRWGALSVLTDTDADTISLLSLFVNLSASQLAYFEVHVERHTRASFPVAPIVRLFTRGAERLRSVELDGLPLRAAWPPLGGVRTLSLNLSCTSMTCADFVHALEEMPGLQTLTIDNYNFDLPPLALRTQSSEGTPSPGLRFHSASLRELSVVSLRSDEDFIARFWSLVSFPALERLSLTCHNDEDIPVFARHACNVRGFPALRALRLNHTQDMTHAGELAALLPHLEELAVHWCSPEVILRGLLPKWGEEEASWPRLRTLSLSNLDGEVMELLDAVIDWKRNTPWPLRELRITSMVELEHLKERFDASGVAIEVVH